MLEIKILAGAESKAFLTDLEKLIKRMEAATTGGKKTAATTDADDAEETTDEDEDDSFTAKKTATRSKKAASNFEDESDDEEETTDTEASDEDADEEEVEVKAAPKGKAKKAKKLTTDDVNDAAKSCVTRIIETRGCTGKEARTEVLKLLKKNFGTESVSEIDEQEDMAKAVTLLNAKK